MLGAALVERGFTALDALDLSPAMLAEAELKGIYGTLFRTRLLRSMRSSLQAF